MTFNYRKHLSDSGRGKEGLRYIEAAKTAIASYQTQVTNLLETSQDIQVTVGALIVDKRQALLIGFFSSKNSLV